MVDRFAARWVLLASMLLLAAAMLVVPIVSPGITAALYGMTVGAAGSSVRALEAASFPRLFGLRHLGPLALSLGRDLTGSYVQVLLVPLVIPVGIAIFGVLAPTLTRAPPLSTADLGGRRGREQ
jgi:hypothetical protein